MARIKDAELSAAGEGRQAMLNLDVKFDWDRADRDREFELTIRFYGADAMMRGSDNIVKTHTSVVKPEDGDRQQFQVANSDGAFDEDQGEEEDEIYAELDIRELTARNPVKTNKIAGRF